MCTGIIEGLAAILSVVVSAAETVAPILGVGSIAAEGASMIAYCLGDPELSSFFGTLSSVFGIGAGVAGGVASIGEGFTTLASVGSSAEDAASGLTQTAGDTGALSSLDEITAVHQVLGGTAQLFFTLSGQKTAASIFGTMNGLAGNALGFAQGGTMSDVSAALTGTQMVTSTGSLIASATGDKFTSELLGLGAGGIGSGMGLSDLIASSGAPDGDVEMHLASDAPQGRTQIASVANSTSWGMGPPGSIVAPGANDATYRFDESGGDAAVVPNQINEFAPQPSWSDTLRDSLVNRALGTSITPLQDASVVSANDLSTVQGGQAAPADSTSVTSTRWDPVHDLGLDDGPAPIPLTRGSISSVQGYYDDSASPVPGNAAFQNVSASGTVVLPGAGGILGAALSASSAASSPIAGLQALAVPAPASSSLATQTLPPPTTVETTYLFYGDGDGVVVPAGSYVLYRGDGALGVLTPGAESVQWYASTNETVDTGNAPTLPTIAPGGAPRPGDSTVDVDAWNSGLELPEDEDSLRARQEVAAAFGHSIPGGAPPPEAPTSPWDLSESDREVVLRNWQAEAAGPDPFLGEGVIGLQPPTRIAHLNDAPLPPVSDYFDHLHFGSSGVESLDFLFGGLLNTPYNAAHFADFAGQSAARADLYDDMGRTGEADHETFNAMVGGAGAVASGLLLAPQAAGVAEIVGATATAVGRATLEAGGAFADFGAAAGRAATDAASNYVVGDLDASMQAALADAAGADGSFGLRPDFVLDDPPADVARSAPQPSARGPFKVDPDPAQAAALSDAWDDYAERLGPFTGRTKAVLVPLNPPGLDPIDLTSQSVPDVPLPYQRAAGHVETLGADEMALQGIIEAEIYHNNPSGTCGNCDWYLPRFLEEGSRLTVVPPPSSVPPTPRWIAAPRIYIGKAEGVW